MSALKSFQRFDSDSSTTTNRSRFSQQSSLTEEEKQKSNSYINKQVERNKKEKLQLQQKVRQNRYNQQILEDELYSLEENKQQFMKVINRLADNINDKLRARNLVMAATAFLGGICSFFTFGISGVVGVAGAYGVKKVFDYEINQLRWQKNNYIDRIQEAASQIRQIKYQLNQLYENEDSLNDQIRNLRHQDTKLFKQFIH